MGGSVALRQVQQLPEEVSYEQFVQLTQRSFEAGVYNIFKDRDGGISKVRMQQIVATSDVYLSYEWGRDNRGRSCPTRVALIADYLRNKGLYVYTDDGQYRHHTPTAGTLSLRQRIALGLENAQCMIVFLTERYINKIVEAKDNQQRIEFEEFVKLKGVRLVLPVAFEDITSVKILKEETESPQTSSKASPLTAFKHRLTIDMIDFETDHGLALDSLYQYVMRTITPLRSGGPFKAHNTAFDNSRQGKHYLWMKATLPMANHAIWDKYALLLADQGLETPSRLLTLLPQDPEFLINLGFDTEHAKLIHQRIVGEVHENFDFLKSKAIDAIILSSNEAAAHVQEARKIVFDAKAQISLRLRELAQMGFEDQLSYQLRYLTLQVQKTRLFEQQKFVLEQHAIEEKQYYHERLQSLHQAIDARELQGLQEEQKARLQELQQCDDASVLSDLFRQLLRKLQVLFDESLGVDIVSTSEGKEREGFDSPKSSYKYGQQQQSVSSLPLHGNRLPLTINQALTISTSTSTPTLLLPSSSPTFTRRKQNSNEIPQLLHETAMALRRISILTERVDKRKDKKKNIDIFVEQGLVKHILRWLAVSYMYSLSFVDFDGEGGVGGGGKEMRNVQLPQETLRALSSLCRRGLHISTLHPQLLYLLGRAGCIELLLDLLRHHLENETVVALALQTLDLLLSVQEYDIWVVHVDRFLGYQPATYKCKESSLGENPYGSYRKSDPYNNKMSTPSFSPNFSHKSFKSPQNETVKNFSPKKVEDSEFEVVPLSLSLVYLLLEKHSRISREVIVHAMSVLLTRLINCDEILHKIRSPLLLTKANDDLVDRMLSTGKIMFIKSRVCMTWCEMMERMFIGSHNKVNGILMLPTAIVNVEEERNDNNHNDEEKEETTSTRSFQEIICNQLQILPLTSLLCYLLLHCLPSSHSFYSPLDNPTKQKEGATLAAQFLRTIGNITHGRDDLKRHILRLRMTYTTPPVSSTTDNYNTKEGVKSVLFILLEHTKWALQSLRVHNKDNEYNYNSPLFANPTPEIKENKESDEDQDRIKLPRRLAMELLRETFYSLSQLLPIPAAIINNTKATTNNTSGRDMQKGNKGNKLSSFMVIPDHHEQHAMMKQIQSTATQRWDPVLSLLDPPYSLCELAMEALSQHCIVVISSSSLPGSNTASSSSSEDAARLLYALLLLFAKMTYQGRNEPCKRLVSLGLCEKLSLILDMNSSHPLPRTIYNAMCSLLLQLFQCDPITVNACQRLLSKTRIEAFITQHGRAMCTATPYGSWHHFYTANVTKQKAKLQCLSCVWTVFLSEQLCSYEETYGHALTNTIVSSSSSTRSSRVSTKTGGDAMMSISSNAVVERLRRAGLPRLLLTSPPMVGIEPVIADNTFHVDNAAGGGVDDDEIMQAVNLAAAGLTNISTAAVDDMSGKLPVFEARPLQQQIGSDQQRCVELLGNVTRATFDEAASRLFGRFELDYGALKI